VLAETMTVLADEFYEWMQVTNYSERTVQNCRTNLGYFLAWCAERALLRPNEITKPMIERYQRYLFHYRKVSGQPLTVRTQQVRLTPIRAFFKWLARNNYILYNPASDIDMPRAEYHLPHQILTVSEVERIMNQPDLSTRSGYRDRAMLETFYSTGIRRLELINLTIYSIELERGVLMVRQGKGKRDRIIPIGERALKWIETYLYDIRPLFVVNPDHGVLFLNRWGGIFTIGGVTAMVRRYITAAGITKKGACHLFRHTMATLMLENGADIRYIQQMLGHTDLESTKVYTRISIRKLKHVHTLTHPASHHPDQDKQA